MTNQEESLKLKLTETIECWINDNCESEAWGYMGMYVPPDLSKLMSDAAFTVLYGIATTQKYSIHEGYLKKA